MKQSETLYKMADYIRVNGFSPRLGLPGGPRCFVGAKGSVSVAASVTHSIDDMPLVTYFNINWADDRCLALQGWGDADAIAACEMAGDIATAEGR